MHKYFNAAYTEEAENEEEEEEAAAEEHLYLLLDNQNCDFCVTIRNQHSVDI